MGQKRLVLYCDIIVSSLLAGKHATDALKSVSGFSSRPRRLGIASANEHCARSVDKRATVDCADVQRESGTSFIGKGKVESCMALPNACAEPHPRIVFQPCDSRQHRVVKSIEFFKLEVRRFVKFLL